MKNPPLFNAPEHGSLHRIFNVLIIAAALTFIPNAAAIIDLEAPADGLDDVWEEFYGAQSVLPLDDNDGDGHDNNNECAAGTDPFDPQSCPAIKEATHSGDLQSATVTFPTENGKRYQLQIGDIVDNPGAASTVDFNTVPGYVIDGTGGDLTVTLSNSANTHTTGSVDQHLWIGISGGGIGSLTGQPGYPASPGAPAVPGVSHGLGQLESAPNVDDNYGGLIRGYIKPPQNGNYTFYIASRNDGEFWLSTDDNPANAVKICQAGALPGESSINIGIRDFTRFAGQQSGAIGLTGGNRYYFELRHKHQAQEDHAAVAWSGPGITSGPPHPVTGDPDTGDSIYVVAGQYLCPFEDGGAFAAALDGSGDKLIRVIVDSKDSDGDTIDDWAEKKMGGENNFFFGASNSTTAPGNDLTVLTNALNATQEDITLSLADGTAIEDNRNSAQVTNGTPLALVGRNVGRFRINRTGTLQPVTVNFSIAPSAADLLLEVDASPGDFNATDVNGTPVTGSIALPFGHVSAQIVVDPVLDTNNAIDPPVGNEYPEIIRCTLLAGAGYNLPGAVTQGVSLVDAQDIPEQELLFVGRSSNEPGSVNPQGTAICSGFLNGEKDFMTVNTLIMASFSSPQNDSHIHKALAGPLPGPIIYEITQVPGDPGTDPLLGPILAYPWDIGAAGGLTGRDIVNSLFGQIPGDPPMYLNWHTNNNQSGELWAILGPETGSIDPPDPPPAPPAITPLAGADLERDVRRFLNQATFGATDAEVDAMLTRIAAHAGDRIAAYDEWMDEQIDVVPQTYLADYTLAADNQEWKLRGMFDPTRWVPVPPNPVPTLPAAWPNIDRTTYFGNALIGSAVNTMVNFPPANWIPTQNYPLTQAEINWGRNENLYVPYDLGEVNHNNRRRGHWLLMLNAKDQFRQKMGYSLQQILVVSDKLTAVRNFHVSAANYQDMLNYYAFEKFRDQFSWVNWSPIMGKWLSSLKNRQAYDTSIPADGIPDVFPDENLAREDMQLFSIGLFVLWLDGTLKLDENTGLPTPTYDNVDITEFARVLTGQSFSRTANDKGDWGIVAGFDVGDPFDTNNNNAAGNDNDGLLWNTNFEAGEGNKYYAHQFNYPMRMFGAFHDPGIKTIAGGHVINNTGTANLDARGRNDIEDAVSWLAGDPSAASNYDMVTSHQSVPPFIALRLIQRFTSSNPSIAYRYRVAKAFADGKGDLRATVKAILLDYEARELALVDNNTTNGLKKPPLDAYMQLIRNFSQLPTAPSTFTEGSFSSVPIADPGIAGAIPDDLNDPSQPAIVAPPADGYLNNFGYPAAQAANFTMNSRFEYGVTDTSTTSQLQMTPFSQETVFNFYLPLYSPGGPVADAGMLSPELQLATETAVIQNINYLWTISTGTNGQGLNSLGGQTGLAGAANPGAPDINSPHENQRLLYGHTPAEANNPFVAQPSDNYDNARVSVVDWGENIITWGPTIASELADITALVDAIDLRLMDGRFKVKYPYNPADNEDPALDGINPRRDTYGDLNFNNDGELMNPREAIIDGLVSMTSNPYSATALTAQNAKRDLFRFALYLMTATPEYLVFK